MSDDRKIVDRRRKKRIGVSKKSYTCVHPYEHTSKAGHIPVCRGGHWPSAVKTIINNTPMHIRTRLGFTNLHRRVIFGAVTADGRWPPLRRTTHPVVAHDHMRQSRSAAMGVFGFWIGRRLYRPYATHCLRPYSFSLGSRGGVVMQGLDCGGLSSRVGRTSGQGGCGLPLCWAG